MKRIIIICEGETEREFCKTLLTTYFAKKDIHIQAPLIKKSMGGIAKWSILNREIETYLNEQDVFVTTLIDYYGLNSKLNIPGWDESHKIININKKIDFLESSMNNAIKESVRYRFIPYSQLHEFEGLLFNEIDVFYHQIPEEDLVGIDELKQTFNDFPVNSELINNKPETSPSHRLKRIIKGYNKIVYGHYLAEAIGLENIRKKCPRFNEWINKIETI